MTEIKAYVRPDMAERVVDGLNAVGISGMTVIDVEAIGAECDPEHSRISVQYVKRYSTVVKLEIVCADEEVETLVDVIQKSGHTGFKGDGMIFVSAVSRAISIRTGLLDEAALVNAAPENE